MLNNNFYHKTIRNTVVAFGTIFNNIKINTKDENGTIVKVEKVPLAYGPIQKFLARLRQTPDIDRNFTITLPRISFEMTGISYDSTRKVAPTQYIRASVSGDTNATKKQYMPVPYNIDFSVSIISKNNDDVLQIVEQILPFFQPNFTVTMNVIPEMQEKRDIPITLTGVQFKDEYEDDLFTRRTIIWELSFTVKTYLYGPVDTAEIIKKSIANISLEGPTTSSRVLQYTVQPKAISDQDGDNDVDANDTALLTADDDFGFNEGMTFYGK
jgi:hypothetical protein